MTGDTGGAADPGSDRRYERNRDRLPRLNADDDADWIRSATEGVPPCASCVIPALFAPGSDDGRNGGSGPDPPNVWLAHPCKAGISCDRRDPMLLVR